MTGELWIEVADRSDLDAARRLGLARSFVARLPRLFGLPGESVFSPLADDRRPVRAGLEVLVRGDYEGLSLARRLVAAGARVVVEVADAAAGRAAASLGVDGVIVSDPSLAAELSSAQIGGAQVIVRLRDVAALARLQATAAAGVLVPTRIAGEVAAALAPPRCIPSVLQRAATDFGSRAAIVHVAEGVVMSYRRLHQHAIRVAQALAAAGVERGDHIAILARNVSEWPELMFGAAYAGSVLVQLNPAMAGRELFHAMTTSRARVLFIEPDTRRSEALAEARSRGLPHLERTVTIGNKVARRDYRAFLAQGAIAGNQVAGGCPDDVAFVQFTSGTTGLSKAATLTHGGVTRNADLVQARLGMHAGDRLCLPLPLFHCFGSVVGLLAATAAGATTVLPGPWFDARDTLDAIRRERASLIYGVPTMFVALLERVDGRSRPRTLRAGLVGGAPVDPSLMASIEEGLGVAEMAQVYGLTEASPVVTMTAPGDPADVRRATVGRPLAGVQLRVVAREGGDTTAGTPGELLTASSMITPGYLGDPQATAAAIESGWLRTGDLATIDEGGWVRIVGRAKEMIIRGGENVYPAEVEAVLMEHPAVRFAAVVGTPSELYGEEVTAFVEPAPGAPIDPAELVEHCRERLSSYKVPTQVRVVDELPKTASGKVIKPAIDVNPGQVGSTESERPPTGRFGDPHWDLPLLSLPGGERSVPARPDTVAPVSRPATMSRSVGWRPEPRRAGWRPRRRRMASLVVRNPRTQTAAAGAGWVRPRRPRWR